MGFLKPSKKAEALLLQVILALMIPNFQTLQLLLLFLLDLMSLKFLWPKDLCFLDFQLFLYPACLDFAFVLCLLSFPFYFLKRSNCLWSIISSSFLAMFCICSVILCMNCFTLKLSSFSTTRSFFIACICVNIDSFSKTKFLPIKIILSFIKFCFSSISLILVYISAEYCPE